MAFYRLAVCMVVAVAMYGCAGDPVTTYTATRPSMSPQRAQDVVKASLTSGRAVLFKNEGGWAKIRDVRLRSDGIGVLAQEGHVDWTSFTNDFNFDAANIQVCYYAGVEPNPSVTHYPNADYWLVNLCSSRAGFTSPGDAQAFADALFVLKNASGR